MPFGILAKKAESLKTRILALQREVSDSDDKLGRLYKLVEEGLTDLDDLLKDRLETLNPPGIGPGRPFRPPKIKRVVKYGLIRALMEKFGRTKRDNLTMALTVSRSLPAIHRAGRRS